MFDETTVSLGGTTHGLFNLSLDQSDLLPDGYCEERVQVDRRRLETMITGSSKSVNLPNANDFFEMVEKQSGAHVHWPSRLKIGAKTKKDPFVKIIGEIQSVKLAKNLILAMLKVKKDRITLKIEIPHASHSHIIGRKGKNTQNVMLETQCHIHFPDSNKHSDAEKNNQVSIAGPTVQVERARVRLRQISPIIITITASVHDTRLDIQKRPISSTDVSIIAAQLPSGQFQWTIKTSENNEMGICMAIERIKQLAGLNDECDYHCRSNFDLRPALLNNSYGLFNLNTIRWIAFHTNTQMQFSPQGTCVVVLGQAQRILRARKYLNGLLPITLQFDRVSEQPIERSFICSMEEKFEVQISEKSRASGLTSESAFLIRTHEANLHKAYLARKLILQEEDSSIDFNDEDEEEMPNEYAFMQNFLEQTKQKGPQLTPLLSLGPLSNPPTLNSPNDSFSGLRDNPDSPDPEESPIAHSLVRSLKMNKGDLWRTPGLERQISRERMLLKANRATYDPVNKVKNEDRHPTDLWSGFGFSNSLPADLLKPRLHHDYWNDDPKGIESFSTQTDQQQATTPISTSKGLASVREEEELSDYNQSNSSNLSSPLNRTTNTQILPFQFLQNIKKPAFAASANFFDTGLGSEITWDIRTFNDPAMVLSQLGCSDYLPLFRDQEIDMPAFLLLDEQNLKDIGVSTMGARKKIFNAIMRLRESALTYGYRL